MKNIYKFIFTLLILIGIGYTSYPILKGNVVFNTDIARDFLLIEDVVTNKPLTLIGPRSGGIPGVFHGPLWLYLNVPAFLIGNGNPVTVGLFWISLYLVLLGITFYASKKIFNEETAYIATALLSISLADSVSSLFNPFGALLLVPLMFYLMLRIAHRPQFCDLLILFFLFGITIQFQVAFGMPLLVLYLLYLVVHLFKKGKLSYLSALLILIIPLSTYALFEIKHDFLQSKSLLNYVTGNVDFGKTDKPLIALAFDRMRAMIYGGIDFITKHDDWMNLIFPFSFFLIFYEVFKKNIKNKPPYLFFLLLYLGYWMITLMFKGEIWSYYYWPFLPLFAMIFASGVTVLNKRLFYIIFAVLYIFNVRHIHIYYVDENSRLKEHKVEKEWKFYSQAVEEIFKDASGEFGYYIFTPDQFGYSQKYAFHYIQKKYPEKKAYSFQKRNETYVFIAPSDNPRISHDWWRKNQVRIDKKPVAVTRYNNDQFVEKYMLTSEEIAQGSDPNLIQNLIFR